jgi:hypothetical protein
MGLSLENKSVADRRGPANHGDGCNRESGIMTTQPTYAPPQRIVISDVDIPFWRLGIVVTILIAVVAGIITMLFGLGWMMLFRPM